MQETTTKEKVLKKVRDALVNAMPAPYEGVDLDSPVIRTPGGDFREEAFAGAFNRTGGKFVYCPGAGDMARGISTLIGEKKIAKLFCRESFLSDLLTEMGIDHEGDPANVHHCDAAITACEALVVRHGSIVFSSGQESGRKSFVAAPLHIVVATNQQMVDDLAGAFRFLKAKYGKDMPSFVTFVSGPSRTADIEKTLVHGAHGPKELYLFMLDTLEQA